MGLEEKVRIVEGMELDIAPKKNLILMLAGQKPNCEIDVRHVEMPYYNEEKGLYNLNPLFYQSIVNDIQKLGFNYEHGEIRKSEHTRLDKETREPRRVAIELRQLFVGDDAKELKDVFYKDPKEKEDHRKYGRLMGFPETAVDAYCNDRSKLYEEGDTFLLFNNPMDRTLDVLRFLSFRPTQNHFDDEVKVARRWHDTVKELSPTIYEKVVRYHERLRSEEPMEEMGKFLYTTLN